MLQGEGVAYRGRILVELSTIPESTPVSKKLETIPNDDLLVVEVNPWFIVSAGYKDVPWLVIFGEWPNLLKLKQLGWISELRQVVVDGVARKMSYPRIMKC